MPRARATATISVRICSIISRVSGRWRVTPMGARVMAPMPLMAQMNRNLLHTAAWMSSGISAVTPWAASKAALRRSARSLRVVVALAEAHEGGDAGMPDMPRGLLPGEDPAQPLQYALLTECLGQGIGGLDTVFQRDHQGLGPHQGAYRLGGRADLPRLDRHDNGIHHADRARIVGSLHLGQMQVALDARDPQSVALHGGQVLAAGDEGDLVAGFGQARAEVAAHAAAAHDRETHPSLLMPMSSGRAYTAVALTARPAPRLSVRGGPTSGAASRGM